MAKPRTFAKKYSFAKLYRVLPKGIGVSLNCLKMLLDFGDIVEILFMVDLCFPFPKNSHFMPSDKNQEVRSRTG